MTSGITKDHLARVVVKNRRHGAANPDAMYQKETTVEAVLSSRVVCEPLHLFMLCSPNEGAAALVLRRADLRARGSGVHLAAAVLRSHIPGSVLSESTPLAGLADDDAPAPTTLAATDAYEEAGLGPSDLHVVECQDTDAGPRARFVRGTRAVRARRLRRAARLGRHRAGRPSPRQPERGTALEGRAARRLPRSARLSSWCASSVASAAAPGGGRKGGVVAHGGPGRQRRRGHSHQLIPPASRLLRRHRPRPQPPPCQCSAVPAPLPPSHI